MTIHPKDSIALYSLSWYKEHYELQKQFDRNLGGLKFFAFKAITLFSKYFLRRFFEYRVKKSLSSLKNNSNDLPVSFVFAENNIFIPQILKAHGLSLQTYPIGIDVTSSGFDSLVSNKLLFLAALANARKLLEELEHCKEDPVLNQNKLRIIKLVGLDFVLPHLLDKHQVFFSFNDHAPYQTYCQYVASSMGMKTVYIQHAPVSKRFPALYYDYNVLFSPDSAEKYRNPQNKEVILLGDLRFIGIERKTEFPAKVKCVLLATNLLDDQEKVLTLIEELSEHWAVILRPHPRDRREWSSKCIVSKSRSIWTDLAEVDAVIAGETAVYLEALYVGVLCYKTSLFCDTFDNYGFRKQGLLKAEFNDEKELIKALQQASHAFNLKTLDHFIGPVDSLNTNLKEMKQKLNLSNGIS